MQLKRWEQRPIEEANLFNPAFCGEILRRAIAFYNKNSETRFPYPLIFLVLPIVLHKSTRESIGEKIKSPLHVWLQENQNARVGFAERAKSLIPITKEAFNFLWQLNSVGIDENVGIGLRKGLKKVDENQGDEEIRDCLRKAEIVGRWFARAGNTANVYTMWGVKP